MPFIAEAEYPNAYQSLDTMSQALGAEYLKRNARLCAELGADIVKVNWSGDAASFEQIIRACERPVVLAGGTLISDEDVAHPHGAGARGGRGGLLGGAQRFPAQTAASGDHAISRVFRDRWPARAGAGRIGGGGRGRAGGGLTD